MNEHNIATPGATKQMLARHGIALKKSLGQNFLIDGNILDHIVGAARLDSGKGALEIGPGLGALTQRLAQQAGKVVAVEIDGRLLPALRETLGGYSHVSIVHGDVLKTDLRKLFDEHFQACEGVSVVANLPYYVTTPIVMKLLESRLPLEHIVVMVQKEVAERMGASPGTKAYGSLTVAVQYYCEAAVVAHVPHTVFIPQPDVESAVIRLSVRKHPVAVVEDEPFFFEVVQACFAQRRKTILNNLQAKFGKDRKEALLRALELADIDPVRRGETLSIAEFAGLARQLADC